jgi:hypothetical protein
MGMAMLRFHERYDLLLATMPVLARPVDHDESTSPNKVWTDWSLSPIRSA